MKKIIYILLALQIAPPCENIRAQGKRGDGAESKWSVEVNTSYMINNMTTTVPHTNFKNGIGANGYGIDLSHAAGKGFRLGLELERNDRSFFNWGINDYFTDPYKSPAYLYSAYFLMQNNFRTWNIYYGISMGFLHSKYNGRPYPYPSNVWPGDVEMGPMAYLKLGIEKKIYRKLYFDLQFKLGRVWVYENDINQNRYDLQGTYNTLWPLIGLKYYFL